MTNRLEENTRQLEHTQEVLMGELWAEMGVDFDELKASLPKMNEEDEEEQHSPPDSE